MIFIKHFFLFKYKLKFFNKLDFMILLSIFEIARSDYTPHSLSGKITTSAIFYKLLPLFPKNLIILLE